MTLEGSATALLKRLTVAGVATGTLVSIGLALGSPEDAPPIHVWWLVTAACSVFVALSTISTHWGRPGLVAAALLMGTSAQLGLTQPLWFPFIQFSPTTNLSYVMLAAIAVQAAITVWTLASRPNLVWALEFVGTLGTLRTILFMVLLVVVSATAMRLIGDQNYMGLIRQFGRLGGLALLNLATVFALAASLPMQPLERLSQKAMEMASFAETSEGTRKFDRFLPWIAAIFALVASSFLCLLAFQRLPHVPDEVAYLFQAQYLLEGRISVSPPPILPPFAYDFLHVSQGQWFSIFPPGWPAVLAFGLLAGLPWLVNPVLAATAILLAHAVFLRFASRGTANIAVLLIAVSPWFIAMSASLMSHTLTLVLLLATWLSLLKARSEGAASFAILSGLFMGILFLTRPLDGLIVGVLTGLWSLGFLRDRSRWLLTLAYGLGCVAVGALIFPYHAHLTGDPLLTPINHYFAEIWHDGANRLGFGADIGAQDQWGEIQDQWGGIDAFRGHSPQEALINGQHNMHALNTELYGWSTGSLVFIFAHLLWGRLSRFDVYMLVILAACVGTFSLYWFSGGFYIGPRYWFMMFLPLIVLTASGLRTTARKLRSTHDMSLAGQRVGFVVATLCIFAMISFLGWRAVGKYYGFRGFHADYRDMVETEDLNGALVFVTTEPNTDFASAFIHNAPNLSNPGPIFARDLGPTSNRAVAARFPTRPIYFVKGRSDARDKARIVRGPLSQESLP